MTRACLVCFVLVACGGGKGGGIPNGDGGSGRVCGGFGGDVCGPTEFCDFARNGCGAADETGICKTRPTACDDNLDPVCGCDGVVHANPCDAEAAGTDLNANGNCQAPAGRFACGFRQCELDFTFCQRFGSDIADEPDGFACAGLPLACQPASCACLQAEGVACADLCTGDAATGVTVTCPGG